MSAFSRSRTGSVLKDEAFRAIWVNYHVLFVCHTKLRSIDIERSTPKFLKNWETQLFQKLADIGSHYFIPIYIPMNANWYQPFHSPPVSISLVSLRCSLFFRSIG